MRSLVCSPIGHFLSARLWLDAEEAEKRQERILPRIQIWLAFPGTRWSNLTSREATETLEGAHREGKPSAQPGTEKAAPQMAHLSWAMNDKGAEENESL